MMKKNESDKGNSNFVKKNKSFTSEMHKPSYDGDDDALSQKGQYIEKDNISNYSFISHNTIKKDQENNKNKKSIKK